MKLPKGFRFAGIHAGLKPSRRDLALILSDSDCSAAGCFTLNEARAAPVRDAEERLPATGIRALIINSGNANALTGPEGLADVQTVAAALAKAIGASPAAVLSASTGIIGMRLQVGKILEALPRLVESLRTEPELAAEAILTTDTVVKMASRSLTIGGRDVTLAAIAKGSGMIAPALATMIASIVTDADIAAEALADCLRRSVETTFNCLTVDGDMSTNDAVFALANAKAGNPRLHSESPELPRFQAALDELCRELTKTIAADGEGATKLVTVEVSGAESFEVARDYARAVAGSSLVKAAIFGADPNWGRVMSALGARAGTLKRKLDPAGCSVSIQDAEVFASGRPTGIDPGTLRARMRAPEILVQARVGQGTGKATAYGCDLSYDYVKINADYSSLIVPTEGGGVAKDDRLVNYSPGFKVSLLVEVLSYIGRLKGQCCVVKYGGAAMVKESLKKSFCDDLSLLRSLGLRPVVVHGGGPEISRTLERLGHTSEFVDGRRITNSADLKVVEMVLTGSINSELVTLLNRDGAHAVGVSGKDGALLRAEKLVGSDGRDLGQVGRITEVNHGFLQMLLDQGYLPVVSPVGLGPNGETYNINADDAAAAVATALKADKLVYLTDVAGILESGELISELSAAQLEAKAQSGVIKGGMRAKAEAILGAVRGGVSRVHIVDGRMPHSVIGELFTDRGVGTLVTP